MALSKQAAQASAKASWQAEKQKLDKNRKQRLKSIKRKHAVDAELVMQQKGRLEQRKMDYHLAQTDVKLAKKRLTDAKKMMQKAASGRDKAVQKAMRNKSFFGYLDLSSFDLDNLLTRRFSIYEYKHYLPNASGIDIYNRLLDFKNNRGVSFPGAEYFPHMTELSLAMRDNLEQTGSEILADDGFVMQAIHDSRREVAEQDCLANLNLDLRREIDYLEKRPSISPLSPPQEQDLASNPLPWAIAACELRTKAYIHAYRDESGQIEDSDISMLYRYFAMQEDVTAHFPHFWGSAEEKADDMIARELGTGAVITSKAIADDYLCYLFSCSLKGDYQSYWDDSQREIAQYPETGILCHQPLVLDLLQNDKTALLEKLSRMKGGNNTRDQAEMDAIFQQTVLLCCQIYRYRRREKDLLKHEAYLKEVANLGVDYSSFNQRWAISHHGRPEDLEFYQGNGD